MIVISYPVLICVITAISLMLRAAVWIRQKEILWRREIQLLPVYICIIVVARFTFFPFSKINGQIQPLIFDAATVFPPRVNFLPFVHLRDYQVFQEAMLNIIGNTAMFIPLGIVWPAVFKELNTHGKVLAAGAGFSLCIEILQLPFYDRVTDIDDLILNSLGFAAGYGIYLLVRWIAGKLNHA